MSAASASAPVASQPDDLPWHGPTLELDERMRLAEGRPLPQRPMAAMGQLDCGQCGYLCQSYAMALAEGREASTSLCVPGAKPTARFVKRLLAEAPPASTATPSSQPVRPSAATCVSYRLQG